MDQFDGSVPLEFIWFSVAAAALAVTCLALELFAPRAVAQRLISVLGLVLALAAAVLWLSRIPSIYALGAAVLAAPCLATWAMCSANVRRVLGSVLTPRWIWAATLVLGLAGAHYLSAQRSSHDAFPHDGFVDLQSDPIKGIEVQTDTGRVLSVFHYQPSNGLHAMEKFTLADKRYQNKLIRIADPTGECNCHGWAFTGGKFAIRGIDVPIILSDNGYWEVDEPQAGDLAIYTGYNGDVTHTGIVRSIDSESGMVLIESKWGALGVYLHALDAHPFGDQYKFYRSQRTGHRLRVVTGNKNA